MEQTKGRYIGIVILILLGSFYFIVATGIANNLEKMVVGFAEEYRQEDLTFSTDKPIEDIAALESESGADIEAFPKGWIRTTRFAAIPRVGNRLSFIWWVWSRIPLASRLKLKEGDTISFANKLDGKSYSLTIDGIVEAYGEQFVYMPLDEFNRIRGNLQKYP